MLTLSGIRSILLSPQTPGTARSRTEPLPSPGRTGQTTAGRSECAAWSRVQTADSPSWQAVLATQSVLAAQTTAHQIHLDQKHRLCACATCSGSGQDPAASWRYCQVPWRGSLATSEGILNTIPRRAHCGHIGLATPHECFAFCRFRADKMPMRTSLQLGPDRLGKASFDGVLPLLFHPILRFLLGCRPGAIIGDSHNELSNRLSNQICRHGHAAL